MALFPIEFEWRRLAWTPHGYVWEISRVKEVVPAKVAYH